MLLNISKSIHIIIYIYRKLYIALNLCYFIKKQRVYKMQNLRNYMKKKSGVFATSNFNISLNDSSKGLYTEDIINHIHFKFREMEKNL